MADMRVVEAYRAVERLGGDPDALEIRIRPDRTGIGRVRPTLRAVLSFGGFLGGGRRAVMTLSPLAFNGDPEVYEGVIVHELQHVPLYGTKRGLWRHATAYAAHFLGLPFGRRSRLLRDLEHGLDLQAFGVAPRQLLAAKRHREALYGAGAIEKSYECYYLPSQELPQDERLISFDHFPVVNDAGSDW